MNKNLMSENIEDLKSINLFTSKEIIGQPKLWLKVWEAVTRKKLEISDFLKRAKKNSNLHIILTGAGTSAFIGDVLEGPIQKGTGIVTKAVPTTDLVTHPEFYFSKGNDILLISFARSGNSPESAKVVQLAGQLSHEVLNLVITCNKKSILTDSLQNTDDLVFLLPPESNDKGLAMTGSFTSMLLTGLLISKIDFVDEKEFEINLLIKYANTILNDYLSSLKQISELEFERVVFLGSGLMKGIARESHLKLQELTDGKIICKYDSFLGFRHGPKAVLNENTLITFLFSNNEYVNKYEVDLVKSISEGRKPIFSLGIMEKIIKSANLDLNIILGDSKNQLSEDLLTIVSVLPAQILGFFKSIKLGLNPDNPSESGMIHRVVQGVKIYPYKN